MPNLSLFTYTGTKKSRALLSVPVHVLLCKQFQLLVISTGVLKYNWICSRHMFIDTTVFQPWLNDIPSCYNGNKMFYIY